MRWWSWAFLVLHSNLRRVRQKESRQEKVRLGSRMCSSVFSVRTTREIQVEQLEP